MQVGGIGSESGSHGSSHHVTGCIHDHNIKREEKGAMRAPHVKRSADANAQPEATNEISLFNILRETLFAGRRLWGRIWGKSVEGNGSEAAMLHDPHIGGLHSPHIAAASTAVQAPQAMLQNNPYFTTASDPGFVKENVFRKIRVKFRDITKQLTKRFAGAFSGRSSLNSGRQRPKEDLRKHSRYRENGLEIDCLLTDDSYLMDSYDRRGEYSKLTTEIKKH